MCQLLDFFFLTTHIVTFHRSHCSLNRKQLNFLPNWILFIFIFIIFHIIFHSVQFSRSFVSDSATPWTAAHQASLSITNSQSLLRLMSIESVMPSNLCHPSSVTLFSSCLQSFPASGSFQISQFFESVGQSIGASASASVFPMNSQD